MPKVFVSAARTRYFTVKEWAKTHAWPSEKALRNFIARASTTGFDKVIVRVGRRILIDEVAFDDWIQSKRKE